ncbi:MAG: copper transporter [Nocardioides sp.]|nr:copper transporter [Nocardioides sp.]
MITFRYHVVTIVSVFLALAIGIALGGGPLKGEVDNSLVTQVETDRQTIGTLRGQITGLEVATDYNDDVVRTVAPSVLGDRLAGRPVAVVALPGASATVVSEITTMVEEAGGTIGGTYRAGEALLDPEQRALADQLGDQLAADTPGVALPEGASGYERVGALLARAIATTEDAGAEVDDASDGILAGLGTASLFTAEGDVSQRASLVLVLAGSAEQLPAGAERVTLALARAVAAGSGGVVIGGPTNSARPGGLVAAVRADVGGARELSTVDSVNRAAGRLAAVLALGARARGEIGHHGAVDAADGVVPDPAEVVGED